MVFLDIGALGETTAVFIGCGGSPERSIAQPSCPRKRASSKLFFIDETRGGVFLVDFVIQ
jgi:hypothetical protein